MVHKYGDTNTHLKWKPYNFLSVRDIQVLNIQQTIVLIYENVVDYLLCITYMSNCINY